MWHIIKSKTKQNKKQNSYQMNSLDKLLSNTTNRFQSADPLISPLTQSNFTPLRSSQSPIIPFPSKNIQCLQQFAEQQIHQTYEQLEHRYKELVKLIRQGKQEKQMMTMLFEKVFLVQEGKQQQMKKRIRRKKNQIEGKYACNGCSKIYSSSTSLARHAKLKHSYCMLEPPLVKYQIPPEPNSIDQLCEVEELNEVQLNGRKLKEEKLSDESESHEFYSCQDSLSEHSDAHDDQPQSQELT